MNKIKGVNMKHITMTEARKLKLDKPQKYFKLAATIDGLKACVIVFREGESLAVHKRGAKQPFMYTIDLSTSGDGFMRDMLDILRAAGISNEQFYIDNNLSSIGE